MEELGITHQVGYPAQTRALASRFPSILFIPEEPLIEQLLLSSQLLGIEVCKTCISLTDRTPSGPASESACYF
jgi:hypothetical protein